MGERHAGGAGGSTPATSGARRQRARAGGEGTWCRAELMFRCAVREERVGGEGRWCRVECMLSCVVKKERVNGEGR